MKELSWKDGPDYIDEPEQVIPDNFLTAPRDPEDPESCLLCGLPVFDSVLCYSCDDEQNERVYVSKSIGYMPFSRQVNQLVGVH